VPSSLGAPNAVAGGSCSAGPSAAVAACAASAGVGTAAALEIVRGVRRPPGEACGACWRSACPDLIAYAGSAGPRAGATWRTSWRVAATEGPAAGAPGETAIAEGLTRARLYKLLAYKDEYEGRGRPALDGVGGARKVAAEFGDPRPKVVRHAPPAGGCGALGLDRKLKLRSGV